MLQNPTEAAAVAGSERNASSPAKAEVPASGPPKAPKLRSCVVCRSRRVRCDKQSPCSNCRRANIACVLPSNDGPPRWARRLERLTNNAAATRRTGAQNANADTDRVMERVRYLENVVRELSHQLQQARATTSSEGTGPSEFNSPEASSYDYDTAQQTETSPASNTNDLQMQFGRLVLQNTERSRYVSSGFWSRVNDELEGLKNDPYDVLDDDYNSSEDEGSPETPMSTNEERRTPFDRHSFLFGRSATQDLNEFQPLPSQIPFLLDVFSENVNLFAQIVHLPTVNKMVRNSRGSDLRLTPANEALLFSIYYAAIASMEEEDVAINFGSAKSELTIKYRLGLECALAKADFLDSPNIPVIQAFGIFLLLVRRSESPRFVYMMTGLLIRMAQYLGLQRDGKHFARLTPFEIEMRRRAWWGVCHLDLIASEDQGTDLTIPDGGFDTEIPMNINDADISPESKQMPTERNGLTDMSFQRTFASLCKLMRQMMESAKKEGAADLQDKDRLLNEIYQTFERNYLQYTTESGDIRYWVVTIIARITVAKMTLIVYLPALFSPEGEDASEEIRIKLLISAIEVAEYNHALNAEQASRQWRWLYQMYPHWHAVVCIMIEVSRRPWSPTVERAWAALHSSWLIPTQTPVNKSMHVWIPLRRMMIKGRKHREDELNRLRADPHAALKLDSEDQAFTIPSSSSPFATSSSVDFFREQWRALVGIPGEAGVGTHAAAYSNTGLTTLSTSADYLSEESTWSDSGYATTASHPNVAFESERFPIGSAFLPWLWSETDPSVDMFFDMGNDSLDSTWREA